MHTRIHHTDPLQAHLVRTMPEPLRHKLKFAPLRGKEEWLQSYIRAVLARRFGREQDWFLKFIGRERSACYGFDSARQLALAYLPGWIFCCHTESFWQEFAELADFARTHGHTSVTPQQEALWGTVKKWRKANGEDPTSPKWDYWKAQACQQGLPHWSWRNRQVVLPESLAQAQVFSPFKDAQALVQAWLPLYRLRRRLGPLFLLKRQHLVHKLRNTPAALQLLNSLLHEPQQVVRSPIWQQLMLAQLMIMPPWVVFGELEPAWLPAEALGLELSRRPELVALANLPFREKDLKLLRRLS